MADWRTATLRLTAALLVASVALVLPGTAGLGGTLPLVALLLGAAAGLYALRDALPAERRVWGVDVAGYVGVAWLGPALAAVLVVVFLGASAGEVQALGGLLGLAGMANYFLRPVYHAVVAGARWVGRLAGASGGR